MNNLSDFRKTVEAGVDPRLLWISFTLGFYARFLRKRNTYTHTHANLSFRPLYSYMRNFCIVIGLEQWYFTLIWNTYMWKLQTFCG